MINTILNYSAIAIMFIWLAMWAILPAILAIVYYICSLLDDNERSFNYPGPMSLPWLRALHKMLNYNELDFDGALILIFVLTVVTLFISLIFNDNVGVVFFSVIGTIVVIYGIFWKSRKFVRNQKERKKLYDRLKGDDV